MNRNQFLAEPAVANFIIWLQERLPTIKVNLRLLPSRFVPGGLEVDVEGVESVLEYYRWKSSWTDEMDNSHVSISWTETSESLNELSQWLRDAISDNNEAVTLQACLEILRWGGVYKLGSINFLTNLSENNDLIPYINNVRNSMSLENGPDINNDLDFIQLFNSGLTKVHSLASADGLPIYDSRVGATISSLSALYEKEKGHSRHLIFPSGDAIGKQLRNPSYFGFREAPKFYTRRVSHAQWAQAQVKLGWIFETILQNSNLFQNEGSLTSRMHALEASFFMIGYDLNAITAINNQPAPPSHAVQQPEVIPTQAGTDLLVSTR